MGFDRPEVKNLIEKRDWQALRVIVSQYRVPDIADVILELEKPDRVILFRSIPRHLAADVFSELESKDQDELLRDLTDEETRALIANLRPDDRTALLEELPGQVTQRLLNLLSPEDLRESRSLLGYPEESVGRVMTPHYVAIRPDWTVAAAMDHVRRKGRDSETINTIYVTDRSWTLAGSMPLKQLVLSSPNEVIADLMDSPAVSLSAFADREEATRTMEKYGLFVLPVVDSDGVLVGMVTGDDVLDIVQEEATEDFHKGAAISPLRESYRDVTIGRLYRSRIVWLMILIFVDLLAAAVMAKYENTISKVVSLVFFLPLLIGCGGNAGSQSSTLIVRSLAIGDVKMGDWAKALAREVGIASALGLTLGLAVFGPAIFKGGSQVGVVVSLSAAVIVTLSSLIGMSLPFVLMKLRFDPAASSSPLITSVADILGVLIYFAFATWYLKI